ncbi:hypothetical protein H4696_003205 [Amycolatopsis lexingtonensis]|uniref:Uncharacterized protein n=1 Tax=Amycolatopsis lexingtonensis TaxID=218822 RepID=A0ABR9HYU0_9PSEU|nr:hypothetical protein [Amycolatopsis lexingtonensis]MBE1496105.1 hypothetical protein [Amycolatopsis lexingtonensis]
MDDEQTDAYPAGRTAGSANRTWPTRHGGGYPPGWLVRYRHRAGRASRATPAGRENFGTVAGRSLRDEHTSTTWVPIRRQGSAADEQVSLVRATDILDARPPGPGERTGI